jgi:clan AA aspartic protease
MGTFLIEPTFRNLHDRTRDRVVPVLVDTGATWTALPRDIVDALGCTALSSRRVRLADGREETWPITIVLVTLEGQELPTICLITPPDSPGLLGAVTLEEFALSVDPVARRLVPVTGYLISASSRS